jgi:hypothetical protein
MGCTVIQAQKVACINHAGFVMSFTAQTKGAQSLPTGDYPINQTRTVDLGQSAFREGLEFWPLVSAELGRTIASDEHFDFAMNGQTVTYEVRGTTLDYSVKMVGQPGGTLPDFPAGVPYGQYPFINWADDLTVPNVWTCEPRTPQDVVDVCKWAAAHSFLVRARGFMHGWSPLTVTQGISTAAVILIDMTKSLTAKTFIPAANGGPPQVRVQAGALMIDLLTYLETIPNGGGSAAGYSFTHTPAPGNLTVGGVLAINAHGTAVPLPPADDFPSGYGSMSNHILELTAVVTDPHSANPDTYALKTFTRGSGDDQAFLTHLGRAMVVEAVLEVIPNYNLRCQSFTNLPTTTLFPPGNPSGPPPEYSFADFVERFGRVEIIWFPFTTNPWLHVWQVAPQKPSPSRAVSGPYNYPFADNLDPTLQAFLKSAFGGGGLGGLTPEFGGMMFTATNNGFDGKGYFGNGGVYPVSRDIWGPSKDVLLYIQDSTLKVTANGYAVQLRKADLQQAVHDFTSEYSALIAKYRQQGQLGEFPINSPLEIRVTGLDDPSLVNLPPGQTATSPVLSSLTYDEVAKANGWDVALWLDVLTIPGTPYSNQFFTDLEQWLLQRFTGSAGRLLPEWSKGWAYTSAGPWTSQAFIQHVRDAYTTGRASNQTWAWEASTLKQYDRSNLFWNPFLETLFAGT